MPNSRKSKTKKKKNQNLPPLVNNDDSSYQDYFSNSSDEQTQDPYAKKNTIVTFDTRKTNKKNKKSGKVLEKRADRIFIDSATDLEDFYDEGDFEEKDNVGLLKIKSNKKKDAPRRKNKEEHTLDEMKTISVMKGKNNKQKLADILSVLKVANVDKKKAKREAPKKNDKLLTFHEIPTDDITLTTDDETTSGEQIMKTEPKVPKPEETEIKEKEKPKQQSSMDTINLDELFSPKKKTEETVAGSLPDNAANEIKLDENESNANNVKPDSDEETEVVEIQEIHREPEVKFAKINIGGGGGAAPKKVENSVQSKSEKKQRRTDSTVSLKSMEKRVSSAGSSSSSSSGAELYV